MTSKKMTFPEYFARTATGMNQMDIFAALHQQQPSTLVTSAVPIASGRAPQPSRGH